MRYLLLILKLALFGLLLTFAVKNTETVVVRYYLGFEWQAPLVFVLLVVFCAGAAFGIVACLGQLYRLRREVAALKARLPRDGTALPAAGVQGKLQDELN